MLPPKLQRIVSCVMARPIKCFSRTNINTISSTSLFWPFRTNKCLSRVECAHFGLYFIFLHRWKLASVMPNCRTTSELFCLFGLISSSSRNYNDVPICHDVHIAYQCWEKQCICAFILCGLASIFIFTVIPWQVQLKPRKLCKLLVSPFLSLRTRSAHSR